MTSDTSAASPVDPAARRRIVIGAICLNFTAAMNHIIVAPALSSIGGQLGDVDHLPWIITAYLLATALVPPLVGRLGDIYGRRIMVKIALAVFLVGSVMCALSPTMLTLVVARGVQGLGGGALQPLTQAVMADAVTPRERGRYQAYFSAVNLAGALMGPLIGGLIASYAHWSLIFWLNVPLILTAYVVSDRALRSLPVRRADHSLDLIGAALLSAMALCAMLALSWGGVAYAWTSPIILALIAAAVVAGALYALRSRIIAEPLLPLDVLRNWMVRRLAVAGALGATLVTGLVAYAPLYFQLVLDVPASLSGLAATALFTGGTAGSVIAGRLLSVNEVWARRYVLSALTLSSVTICALVVLAGDLTPYSAAALLMASQFGIGTTFPTTIILLQNAVEHRHIGIATSTLFFTRALASAAGSAVLGAIFLGGGHGDTILRLKDNPGVSALSFDPGLTATFTLLLGVVAVALVLSLFVFASLGPIKLRRTVE